MYRVNIAGTLTAGTVDVDVFSASARSDEGVNLDTKLTIYNSTGAVLCTLNIFLLLWV